MKHLEARKLPTLWRLHIRTASQDDLDHSKVVNFCIREKVAGIGWGIDLIGDIDADQYAYEARKKYQKNVASLNFVKDVAVNDLIWARGKNGIYYLGRVTGDWRYVRTSPSAELDIPNQRSCDWYEVGSEENIPGGVISHFRAPRALQRIPSERMVSFSMWLYNQKSEVPYYPDVQDIGVVESADAFFDHIDDQDCEDVVGLFLQRKYGYLIVPSTCKKDTAGYEFVLVHPQEPSAVVQVKQGNIGLNDRWTERAGKVFLFSTKGNVSSVESERVVRLDKNELFSFVKENQNIMPSKILYWLNEKYRQIAS